MSTIGKNIRRLRLEKGFKVQGRLAEVIGVTQPRLSDWEKDRYGAPELLNLLRIAKALGVSVDAILAGVDPDYDRLLCDLTRHAEQRESALSEGGASATDPPDLLAQRLQRVHELGLQLREVIAQLAAIAADCETETRLPSPVVAGGRRRHRKAG